MIRPNISYPKSSVSEYLDIMLEKAGKPQLFLILSYISTRSNPRKFLLPL